MALLVGSRALIGAHQTAQTQAVVLVFYALSCFFLHGPWFRAHLAAVQRANRLGQLGVRHRLVHLSQVLGHFIVVKGFDPELFRRICIFSLTLTSLFDCILDGAQIRADNDVTVDGRSLVGYLRVAL